MEKIEFSEMNNEIEKFVEEKNNIIELGHKMEEIHKETNEKKQELNAFPDKESGFYKDLAQEVESKENEASEIFRERDVKLRNLKEAIETKKNEIIDNLKSQLQVIDENRNENIEEIKEEKERLEEELKLNDVTKEEFMKMDSQKQQEVRNAKERYLINKRRLNELSPKIELLELLKGKEPKERYLEINALISDIDKEFNYDNIETFFKEPEEIAETTEIEEPEQILETEELSNPVESGKPEQYSNPTELEETEDIVEPEEIEKQTEPKDLSNEEKQEDKVTARSLARQIERKVREDSTKKENFDNKIQEIFIDEQNGKVEIKTENSEEKKVIDENIDEILANKKQIFKDNEISNKCAKFVESRIKRFFLMRKLNPVVVKVLGDNNESKAVEEYIKSVYAVRKTPFRLVHDLRQTSLTGLKKMMMKRFAKFEKENLDATVLKDEKQTKLLTTSLKRKIKGSVSTIGKKVKYTGELTRGEALKARLYVKTKSLAEKLKVDDETLQKLNNVSRSAKDNESINEIHEKDENEK